MTIFENKVFDEGRPWLEIPDTEENILRDLDRYTLDPVFETYGGFVNRAPDWLSEEVRQARAGHTMISGNFLTYSHAFRVCTDDEALIGRLEAAINRNMATPEYQAAKAKTLKTKNWKIHKGAAR